MTPRNSNKRVDKRGKKNRTKKKNKNKMNKNKKSRKYLKKKGKAGNRGKKIVKENDSIKRRREKKIQLPEITTKIVKKEERKTEQRKIIQIKSTKIKRAENTEERRQGRKKRKVNCKRKLQYSKKARKDKFNSQK